MKAKWLAGALLAAITFSACDEDTQGIGVSLTNDVDHFTILTDTFNVSTRSIMVDSVLSRSSYTYLGRIKDPETQDYVTSSYMTQFMQLESMATNFIKDESTVKKRYNGRAAADSCVLNIYINAYVGDTLAPMKVTAYEMQTPAAEGKLYYSDYDPIEEGLIRTDGICVSKPYTYVNYHVSDSIRNSSSYIPFITVPLNDEYTDKNGVTYDNYGTYLMHSYYDHPEYFKNSYAFVHNVCPGFFFKTTDGAGLMSEVYTTEMVFYYTYESNDSTYVTANVFTGTEEVLQTTTISTDKTRIDALLADNSCTYLKTPSGVFTEVTLPIDDIMRGHENDTISSAKVAFTCYNGDPDDIMKAPTNVVMIPKAELYTFFEEENLPDYRTSFLATLTSASNTYTFNNISELITNLYNNKSARGDDWNKVVLVPVDRTSVTQSNTTTTMRISNLMSMTSTRLVGGSENKHAPITISVIYSRSK